jgi:phosphate transport system permease protein
MTFDRVDRRRWKSRIFSVLALLCVVAALIPLASIIGTAFVRGAPALSIGFFTQPLPAPCGTAQLHCSYGGVGPYIEGTIALITLSSLIAIPIGILIGIYLSEYGRRGIGRVISFFTDVLTGVPSIVVGIFVYTVTLDYIVRSGGDPESVYSALSGATALAIIMLPIVARTTEEAMRAVPDSVREAALALGIPKHRTTLRIVLTAALPAVLTGALLGVMRVGGEAAPLLFTAFNNPLGYTGVTQPAGALPTMIYNLYQSPQANWQTDAWAAALVLVLIMVILTVVSHIVFTRVRRRIAGGQ